MEITKLNNQFDWLRLARVTVFVIMLLSAAAYVAGLVYYYQRLLIPDEQFVAGTTMSIRQMHQYMADIGLPVTLYALFSIIAMAALGLVYLAVALLLLLYKPKDRVAIFTALILTVFGTGFAPVFEFVSVSFPQFSPVLSAWSTVAFTLLFLFCLMFPDGRFVPRWTAIFAVFWIAQNFIPLYWPDSPLALYNYPDPLGMVFVFLTLGTFIFIQVYRYKRVSNSLQRQQTRWVVIGLVNAMVALPLLWVIEFFWPVLNTDSAYQLLTDVLTTLIYGVAFGLIPITIGVAISRYHLWDIDVILRRTVGYTLLTFTLGGIYLLVIIVLQFFFDLTFQAGDLPMTTVLSTLAIAALFNPLRRRIQEGIDGRFYRRKQDSMQALSMFHARLRNDVEQINLKWALRQVALETIQPQTVSVWISSETNHSSMSASRGTVKNSTEKTVMGEKQKTGGIPGPGAVGSELKILDQTFGERMVNILGSLRRLFTRPEERSDKVAAGAENDRTGRFTPIDVEIVPDEVLVDYLEKNPVVQIVDRIKLDSPSLECLKSAGVELIVPLVSRGELIGMLNLGPRMSEQEYSSDDIALLNNLAVQATPAVRVAQMVREQQAEAQERERIQQELKVARFIQQTLLPKELPDLPGWSIDTYYQPARAVGGDFYDFIYLPGNRLGIFVGDVTDKGVPAALVMATTRRILRFAAEKYESPGQVLWESNNLLHQDIPSNMFVTCLYAILDVETGTIRYANAGHNPPYACINGQVTELRATGMPLGLLPDMTYEEKEATIQNCQRVLFFSDGVVEAHSPNRHMFSFDRVKGLVSASAAGEPLIAHILDDLKSFCGKDWEQEDDVTLLTLERFPRESKG